MPLSNDKINRIHVALNKELEITSPLYMFKFMYSLPLCGFGK